MRARTAILVGVTALLGLCLGSAAPTTWFAVFSRPNWQEIAWPFPRDAWPEGRAFRCNSAACGGVLEVYVRPKVGLCNCGAGITGDAEVDAVSDVDLMAPDFVPLADGERVEMAGMVGRSRPYRLVLPGGKSLRSAGIALSHRCDLVAAASAGEAAGTPQASKAIAALLSQPALNHWLLNQMGKS